MARLGEGTCGGSSCSSRKIRSLFAGIGWGALCICFKYSI